MTRKLILVRHSLPLITGGQPASRWPLSDEGRRRCEKLAPLLAAHRPTAVVTSMEPKAVETGQIVSERLGIPVETAQNLHEHERPSIDLDTLERFQDKVARLLENPGERVFGAETGEQARKRFSAAVSEIMTRHPAGNMVIVTHGTVMTLFVAHATEIDPVPFWKGLGLPALVVLSYPDLSLVEVIESTV